MCSIFLSTAIQDANDSSREKSPLPLQLAFYVLLSKLGSAILPETSCIRCKNKYTKVILLSVFIILDLSRFIPHKNEIQILEYLVTLCHNFLSLKRATCNHVKRQIFKVINFYAALSLREKMLA